MSTAESASENCGGFAPEQLRRNRAADRPKTAERRSTQSQTTAVRKLFGSPRRDVTRSPCRNFISMKTTKDL